MFLLKTNSYNDRFKNQIHKQKKLSFLLLILGFFIIICVVIAVMLGEATIHGSDVIRIIGSNIINKPSMIDDLPKGIVAIVWDIRSPRIITGVLVGAGLAISGSIFQALLMNPLADPYTIGISTGAALGATIAIYISSILQIAHVAVLPSAFIGAILTLFIVIKISSKSHTLSSSSLIISGIIVSSIGSAFISLIKSLAGDEVSIIVFWLMGSLASRTWEHVIILLPVILIAILICLRYSNELNIFCTGEKNALTYGVEVKKVRLIFLITASLITAACVSVSGIIGFVGLIIPHMIRQFITTDHKYLIPLSGLMGAILLMIADNITRTLLAVEIPVGVLTTLIGGPFFIYLFTKKDEIIGGIK